MEKLGAIIVSGPSGAGKSSICQRLVETYPERYEIVRSVTTREPRKEGENYTFSSREEFLSMKANGLFLESNTYVGNGACYATPRAEVERIWASGKTAVLDIDVNGREQLLENREISNCQILSVFIFSSPVQVYNRLLERKTESMEKIIKRLEASIEEIAKATSYDMFIENKNLVETVQKINEAVHGLPYDSYYYAKQYITDMRELISRLTDWDSVEIMMQHIRQFCEIRDWDQYNNPKDLAIGVSTEANELLDIFRFKTELDMSLMMRNSEVRESIGEELADVLFFLLRFCSMYKFDPGKILADKIRKNEVKYPVDIVKGRNDCKRRECIFR